MNWRSRFRELGFEQTSITRDFVSVGAQACQFFVDHRRHPLAVVKVFPFGWRARAPAKNRQGGRSVKDLVRPLLGSILPGFLPSLDGPFHPRARWGRGHVVRQRRVSAGLRNNSDFRRERLLTVGGERGCGYERQLSNAPYTRFFSDLQILTRCDGACIITTTSMLSFGSSQK